ncbi:MAG TPA: hypothetical protein VHK86_08335 [Nitrososphaera sp.]|nr:hypothetical protein [Nitrososphaera sp.]
MSDNSDEMKKEEKLASKGQQDRGLSKGAETEMERSTKRPPTGV